jgi:MFS family permease
MVSSYRSLLRAQDVRRLLASSLLARMPLGIYTLALLLLVDERSGSFLAAGLAVAAFTLSGAALAPVQGTLIDRLGQLRVLAPCAAAQGTLLLALVVLARSSPVWPTVVVSGLAGALNPPVSACVRVLWPMVAGEESTLEAAYSLDAVTQELIWVLGPLLVAVVVAILSPGAAVVMGAAFTILGTALFLASPLARTWRGERHEYSPPISVLSSRGVRALLCSAALMGTMIGALEVGLPALATHLGSHGYAGVLLAMLSVGSIIGGLLYGAHAWRLALGERYATLLALLAVLTAPLLLVHTLLGGVMLSLLAGVSLAPVFSCQYALLGKLAPRGAVAQAFTWQTAALVCGISAGSGLGGALVALGGAYLPFVLGGAGAGAACVVATLERERISPVDPVIA